MASVTTIPNRLKLLLLTKQIDCANDVFKINLMNSAFVFDKDTHGLLADVAASQIATGNGYTQDSKTLTGVAVTQDNENDMVAAAWSDVTWTAAGGSIGPTGSAIVYDDTATDKPIVMHIDFGDACTTADGYSFQIKSPKLTIS
jgi:hypothetical protein